MSRPASRTLLVSLVLLCPALAGPGCSASKAPASVDGPALSVVASESAENAELARALRDLEQHRPEDAIRRLDAVISNYGEPETGPGVTQSYCSRSLAETMYYLILAQSEERNAVVLESNAWAEAYYLKGYSLVELGRFDEAKRTLEKALVLSPKNSRYRSELGHVWQTERNWPRALETFTEAEKAAKYSPDSTKIPELTRAMRGQGFVLVELGRLDEAEIKFREALAADRHDSRSRQELEYIEQLRRQ